MERIHAKRSGNKVNSSTPHWVRDRLDSKQPPRGHGLARMRPPRAWCVGGPRRPRGRGPPTAAESARAAPAPARVAAREVPFPACSALPSPPLPGQQNGRCSLATRHRRSLSRATGSARRRGLDGPPKTSRARRAPRRAPRDRRAPGGWAPRRAAAWGHGVSPSF